MNGEKIDKFKDNSIEHIHSFESFYGNGSENTSSNIETFKNEISCISTFTIKDNIGSFVCVDVTQAQQDGSFSDTHKWQVKDEIQNKDDSQTEKGDTENSEPDFSQSSFSPFILPKGVTKTAEISKTKECECPQLAQAENSHSQEQIKKISPDDELAYATAAALSAQMIMDSPPPVSSLVMSTPSDSFVLPASFSVTDTSSNQHTSSSSSSRSSSISHQSSTPSFSRSHPSSPSRKGKAISFLPQRTVSATSLSTSPMPTSISPHITSLLPSRITTVSSLSTAPSSTGFSVLPSHSASPPSPSGLISTPAKTSSPRLKPTFTRLVSSQHTSQTPHRSQVLDSSSISTCSSVFESSTTSSSSFHFPGDSPGGTPGPSSPFAMSSSTVITSALSVPSSLPPRGTCSSQSVSRLYQQQHLQQLQQKELEKREDKLKQYLSSWKNEVLPAFDEKRELESVKQMWRFGVPSAIRGVVWRKAIGNRLNITYKLYEMLEMQRKATVKLMQEEAERRAEGELGEYEAKEEEDEMCHFVNKSNARNAEDEANIKGKKDMLRSSSQQMLSCELNESKHKSKEEEEEGKEKEEEEIKRSECSSLKKDSALLPDKDKPAQPAEIRRSSTQSSLKKKAQPAELSPMNDLVKTMTHIQLDLPRTLGQYKNFQQGGPDHEALCSVLFCVARYRPDVDYVQGMSFLAIMLLTSMDAFDAFVCLANMVYQHHLLFRMFSASQSETVAGAEEERRKQLEREKRMGHVAPPGLLRVPRDTNGIVAHLRLFSEAIKLCLPEVDEKLRALSIEAGLFGVEWFMTLFVYTLPLDTAALVWDRYTCDGEIALVQAGLGVLKSLSEVILSSDFEVAMTVLHSPQKGITVTMMGELMDSVHMTKKRWLKILQKFDTCERDTWFMTTG
ncbi:Tre-2/Bub2/Cdc16 (TBC) domain-containing protein G [Monocercomonoides exilis]|uniref:Tre-2/Bub2/Cdc16 (TBC) domain-containing protein G n=1 Tax=Monocercomonoides exilis TaxID=2049356 RepID=UPI00355AAB11|nr:Tre-2/Bub2/Cdc16 (TBC) domain-containing protein G [Monocercomonoides exilis]|eukprot:MONOS_12982.1-p1 / transcript=MONOS_12982.1 / gene=MONOS_12982 / organism=Monocercomonoides_exilis_PA203 / gene_product=Tre-2/Bub2/Cdc16 (TBC) domain-containing protein G / transcript_product=Tre-2/Bub2/Cdc16 (TBC) domain-containing protein G / location=Mono_scaffold00763:467-3418(+) / protein_length=902 / sequence_SO=supercontig / SO=protein_coding / is_pseudo=false